MESKNIIVDFLRENGNLYLFGLIFTTRKNTRKKCNFCKVNISESIYKFRYNKCTAVCNNCYDIGFKQSNESRNLLLYFFDNDYLNEDIITNIKKYFFDLINPGIIQKRTNICLNCNPPIYSTSSYILWVK